MHTHLYDTPTPSAPSWGFLATILWTLIILTVWVATQVGVAAVVIMVMNAPATEAELAQFLQEMDLNDVALSLGLFTNMLVCSALIAGIIKLKKGASLKHYLALHGVDRKTLKHWLLIFIGLIIASDLLTTLLSRPLVPEDMTTTFAAATAPILLTLAIVIAAPIVEELFFRGFIMTGLMQSFVGPIGAILITAGLWAAIHTQYDWYGILTIFVMGLLLGLARLKTGSVILTIVLHAFANAVASLQTWILLA